MKWNLLILIYKKYKIRTRNKKSNLLGLQSGVGM